MKVGGRVPSTFTTLTSFTYIVVQGSGNYAFNDALLALRKFKMDPILYCQVAMYNSAWSAIASSPRLVRLDRQTRLGKCPCIRRLIARWWIVNRRESPAVEPNQRYTGRSTMDEVYVNQNIYKRLV